MRVLVIEPGHGSVWLEDAKYVADGAGVTGWDDGGVGSPLMPDDYKGEPIQLTYDRSLIRKLEDR